MPLHYYVYSQEEGEGEGEEKEEDGTILDTQHSVNRGSHRTYTEPVI